MKRKIKLLIVLIFLIISINIIIIDNLNTNRVIVEENKKVEEFLNKNSLKKANFSIKNKSKEYIAVIKIPKIKLSKVLINPNSMHNNINENIAILKPVQMPDQYNSTLVLAAHSGNSDISYFKNLYKLRKNDKIYIYYKDKKYTYTVVKYYETSKTGNIKITRTNNKKRLVLTTCKQFSFNRQLVYIAIENGDYNY